MKKPGFIRIAVLFIMVASSPFLKADDDEPALLRRRTSTSRSSIDCCPQGVSQARCAERLARGTSGNLLHALCEGLALSGRDPISRLQPSIGCPTGLGPQRNDLGILTSQYHDRGWWSDRAPPATPVRTYLANHIAMSSEGCSHYPINGQDPPGWQEGIERCRRTGYQGIHLYVNLTNDGVAVNARLAEQDNWNHDPLTAPLIRTINVRSTADLKTQLAALLMECKIVDYLFIDSHGGNNSVVIGEGSAAQVRTIGEFLGWALQPCLFSPHTQIQFTGCDVACAPASNEIGAALNSIFLDENFRAASGNAPFPDIKFLFNTDLGVVATRFRSASTFSLNDIGIQFSMTNGSIVSDLAPAQTPLCSSLHGWRRFFRRNQPPPADASSSAGPTGSTPAANNANRDAGVPAGSDSAAD